MSLIDNLVYEKMKDKKKKKSSIAAALPLA